MKTKIQEVQDYFIGKIATGDYVILESGEHVATVLIDELYKFTLWIGNEFKHFTPYNLLFNFMDLEIPEKSREFAFQNFTQKNRLILEAKTIAEIELLENKIANLKSSL